MTIRADTLLYAKETADFIGSWLFAESVSDPLHLYSTGQAEQFTMSEHRQFELCASALSLAKLFRANAPSSMKLFHNILSWKFSIIIFPIAMFISWHSELDSF